MTQSPPTHPAQALAMPIQLRFADMDALGHVNNVAVVRLLEEARARLFYRHPVWRGQSLLVARQEVEYRAVLDYNADDALVRIWASRVGGSSFELSYTVEDQAGQVTAVAATTLVITDDAGRPIPIPTQARSELDAIAGPPIAFRGR